MTTHLSLSWGVSRGRDTYGYNICRLDDQTTGERYRCNGGGYDMVGTVLGQWLESVHQDRLLELARSGRAYTIVAVTKGRGVETNQDGLYGMAWYDNAGGPGHDIVRLDGACGVESMLAIGKAIGLRFERTYTPRGVNRGATTGWIVTEADES